MKEQIITFETAKLAKEKGFFKNSKEHGKVTGPWYNAFGSLNGRTDLNKDQKFISSSNLGFQNEEERANNVKDTYYASNQGLLQKWLREIHDIHLIPEYIAKQYNFTITKTKSLPKRIILHEAGTYEKALEIGLVEALKLIK